MGGQFVIATSAALLIGVAPASAQVAGQWRSSAQIWGTTCGYCHESAQVGPPVRGMHLPAETIRHTVRNGLSGMPAFPEVQIGDAELAELARWVSETEPLANGASSSQTK